MEGGRNGGRDEKVEQDRERGGREGGKKVEEKMGGMVGGREVKGRARRRRESSKKGGMEGEMKKGGRKGKGRRYMHVHCTSHHHHRNSQSRLVREDKTCNTVLLPVSMTANPLLVPTANLKIEGGIH